MAISAKTNNATMSSPPTEFPFMAAHTAGTRWLPGLRALGAENPKFQTPIEERLSPEQFRKVALTLATIQVAAAGGPLPAEIPRSPLSAFPEILDGFRAALANSLSEVPELDPDAPGLLEEIQCRVAEAARVLAATAWPESIDHVDLNVSNAFTDGDRMVIIDWEEAVVGFPAFSLDRLIDDAHEFDRWTKPGLSPTATTTLEEYAERVPWGQPEERLAIIDLAVRLNRIAYAGQALESGGHEGGPNGHPQLMAFCTRRIIEAWPEAT